MGSLPGGHALLLRTFETPGIDLHVFDLFPDSRHAQADAIPDVVESAELKTNRA
ncbi:hypothetical protein [Pseudomonas kribbensis]|uniref:hypothetical protein n=1 Tax=Pseudomonas kribbensis TaxID=1628086 RepID=UPI001430E3DC|nr:hypothetical protein [Pseudomonas kribbensis]